MSFAFESEEIKDITVEEIFNCAKEIAHSLSSPTIGLNHVLAAYIKLGCKTTFEDTANIKNRVPIIFDDSALYSALTGTDNDTTILSPDSSKMFLAESPAVVNLKDLMQKLVEHYPNNNTGVDVADPNKTTPMHVLLAISKMVLKVIESSSAQSINKGLINRLAHRKSTQNGKDFSEDLKICVEAFKELNIRVGMVSKLLLSGYYKIEPKDPPTSGDAAMVHGPDNPDDRGPVLSLVAIMADDGSR